MPDYPWQERVSFEVSPAEASRFTLALRVPGWCRGARININGQAVDVARVTRKGYARLERVWPSGDTVELRLPMPIERIEADPRVRMNCGKVALQRGPVVYCLEQVDNGRELADLAIRRTAPLTAEHRPRLLGGVTVIRGQAQRRRRVAGDGLYRRQRRDLETVGFTAVPYSVWANRKAGKMIVWIHSS